MLQEILQNENRPDDITFSSVELHKGLNIRFYPEIDDYLVKGEQYSTLEEALKSNKRVYCGINFDTEFVDMASYLLYKGVITVPEARKLVSKQYSSWNAPRKGVIYSNAERHRDFGKYGEWGELVGATLEPNPEKTKFEKTLVILVSGHFLTAEINFWFNGILKEIWRNNCLTSKYQVKATKRLQPGERIIKGKKSAKNTVLFKEAKLVLPDGTQANLEFKLVDTAGLHGVAGYKDIASNTGVKLLSKELSKLCCEELKEQGRLPSWIAITDNNANELAKSVLSYIPIERMDLLINECPKSYDAYSLGDLYLSEILLANNEKFKIIEQALGISEEWHRPPKLTMGSQIARLIEQVFCVSLGLNWLDKGDKETVYELLQCPNPQALVDRVTTAVTLGKTFGGRCLNNMPLLIKMMGVLVDADEDGCYGNGMRLQCVPFGNAEIMEFPLAKGNEYPTLEQWEKSYQKDLIPGCWHATIDTGNDLLEYPQDFFPSWHVPNGDKDNYKPYEKFQRQRIEEKIEHHEEVEKDANSFLKDGHVKVYKNQIRCGVLTHDGLQWINNICTPKQRKELKSKIKVVSSIVYPKSTVCNSYEEYHEKVSKYKGKRTFKRFKGNNSDIAKRVVTDNTHTYWFPMDLGELMIDDLLCQRKRYPKKPSKHPLNTMFKLCINTIYGVFASSFFKVSNSVVGNNITARARAFGWYYEKSCRATGIITDGGVLDVNKVVFPASKWGRINGENMIDSKAVFGDSKNWKHLKLAPITGDEVKYSHTENEVVYYQIGNEIINQHQLMDKLNNGLIIDHMISSFSPKIDALNFIRKKIKPIFKVNDDGEVIKDAEEVADLVDGNYKSFKEVKGYFDWEMKAVYSHGTFHGTSNYALWNEHKNIKNESKSNNPKISMRSYNEKTHYDENGQKLNISPSRQFLTSLDEEICVPEVSLKTEIIKLTEFQAHPEKYLDNGLAPGDSRIKVVQILPLSLSQFKFHTIKQALTWDKAKEREKLKYGWFLEYFFMEKRGGIWVMKYGEMIRKVYDAIESGVEDPFEYFDPHENRTRDFSELERTHPYYELKKELKEKTQIKVIEMVEDF